MPKSRCSPRAPPTTSHGGTSCPPGLERVNGVPVRRFRVKHERDPLVFARWSERVFDQPHSMATSSTGSTPRDHQPGARRSHREACAGIRLLLFFSYRYYHAYHGARAAASRAILVPTAERDAAVGLSIFGPIFRGVRALMYNSPEERAMIQAVSGNQDVPSVVVGIGSDVPPNPQPARFRRSSTSAARSRSTSAGSTRTRAARSCSSSSTRTSARAPGRLSLVLVGNSLLPIPKHPRIRHLGFLDDADKFDAMAAAELLIMPSYFESLSMVALEAWALGRPVLANAKMRRAEGPVHPQQRRAVLRRRRRSSSRRCARSSRIAG